MLVVFFPFHTLPHCSKPPFLDLDRECVIYRNLLTMTAMMSKTKIVMIAIVMIRFVAILNRKRRYRISIKSHISLLASLFRLQAAAAAAKKGAYLRAIPLSVLTLRST